MPAATFWGGCAGWDAGHGIYLLLLLGPLLARTLRLQPLVHTPSPSAPPPPPPHPNSNVARVGGQNAHQISR